MNQVHIRHCAQGSKGPVRADPARLPKQKRIYNMWVFSETRGAPATPKGVAIMYLRPTCLEFQCSGQIPASVLSGTDKHTPSFKIRVTPPTPEAINLSLRRSLAGCQHAGAHGATNKGTKLFSHHGFGASVRHHLYPLIRIHVPIILITRLQS